MANVTDQGNNNDLEKSENTDNKITTKSNITENKTFERDGDKAPPPKQGAKKPGKTNPKEVRTQESQTGDSTFSEKSKESPTESNVDVNKAFERDGDKAPPPKQGAKKPKESSTYKLTHPVPSNIKSGDINSQNGVSWGALKDYIRNIFSKSSVANLGILLCSIGFAAIIIEILWVVIYHQYNVVPFFSEIAFVAITFIASGFVFLVVCYKNDRKVDDYRRAESSYNEDDKDKKEASDKLFNELNELYSPDLNGKDDDPYNSLVKKLEDIDEKLFSEIKTMALETAIVTGISPNKGIDTLSVMINCARIMRLVCGSYGMRPSISIFVHASVQSLASGATNDAMAMLANLALEDLPIIGKLLVSGSKICIEAYFNYFLMVKFATSCIEEYRPLKIKNRELMQSAFKVNMTKEIAKKLGNEGIFTSFIETIDSAISNIFNRQKKEEGESQCP